MVAAAINTASLLFGLLFISYLFLSLYCCLLFHLKVETDYAREAIGLDPDNANPSTLRQDQRYLTRSMRRLTIFASVIAIAMAVTVFLAFPRNTGAGLFGQMQFQATQTLTGFNDRVSFQQVARITQNHDVVAHVRVWKNDQPVSGTEPLLLRGNTLSVYNSDARSGGAWQWSRLNYSQPRDLDLLINQHQPLTRSAPRDQWRQEITLKPTGTPVLFAMPGVISIRPLRDLNRIRYFAEDEIIHTHDRLVNEVKYEVISRNDLERPTPGGQSTAAMFGGWFPGSDYEDEQAELNTPVAIDLRIEEFARRPQVSGSDEQGPLVDRLPPPRRGAPPTDLHVQIAQNIERFLKTNFTYTLDLTDARRINNQDPMVAFLYDLERGHCEYFAGAMTLLCQSLGINARVVVGFRCDEFNQMGGYYIVKQSHAHAWVEVQTPTGWRTFDPTSGRETVRTADTTWQKIRHFFDYLEYTWANSVVAYDYDSQTSMLANVEHQLSGNPIEGTSGALGTASRWFDAVGEWFRDANMFFVSLSKVLTALIGLMILVLIGAIGWFLLEKLKLQRRARRIGLDALPLHDKMRLARQLGFYDELLRVLARHEIVRPPHLTPMEFSRSISFLPSNVYDSIQRLTNLFYRIRYGRQEISPDLQRRLRELIHRLESSIPHVPSS